jgi:outer membrane receptor protein involved in Fe transport
VDWDWLLPHDVERVEVVEGPGAWLYGDGSEGGIVNVVRPPIRDGLASDCGAQFGSFGLATGSIVASAQSGAVAGSLRGSARRALGWRDHSRERTLGGGAAVRWQAGEHTRVGVNANLIDGFRQDPGALNRQQLEADREQADTPADYSKPRRLLFGAQLTHGRPSVSEWRLSPYVRTEDNDQVKTLLFQTLDHPTTGTTGGVELGWRRETSLGGRPAAFSAQAQVERARLRSRYFEVAGTGRGPLRADLTSWRTTWSGFAGARVALDPLTSARLGVRGDVVRVRSKDGMAGTSNPDRTFSLASPFVALSRQIGAATLYGSFSTAFRVPTLNQLFDRRPIDTPFGTFYLSNPGLAAQRSHGAELGGRVDAGGGGWASLALYSLWVRDEIDFDAATNTYNNIGRSWHRGVQGAAFQPLGSGLSANLSLTYSPTTIRGGDDDGNQINSVPRRMAYGSLRWTGGEILALESGVRWVGTQYLDKANQFRLGEHATVDVTGSLALARLRATVRVANLLDRKFADSGFLVLGEERFTPAPGRSFTVSLSAD